MLRHHSGGAGFLVAQFRVLVNVLAPGKHLGLDRLGGGIELRMNRPGWRGRDTCSDRVLQLGEKRDRTASAGGGDQVTARKPRDQLRPKLSSSFKP